MRERHGPGRAGPSSRAGLIGGGGGLKARRRRACRRGGGRAHLKVFEQIAIYNKHNDISKIEDQTRKKQCP